ncbi:MAG: hypothetical protein HY962_09120 [Ignavibacteriae bacterium]|nr:hypothetical protein [Ignavibacteriota bacterium]
MDVSQFQMEGFLRKIAKAGSDKKKNEKKTPAGGRGKGSDAAKILLMNNMPH